MSGRRKDGTAKKPTLLITERDVRAVFEGNLGRAIESAQNAFAELSAGKVIQPEKTSQVFDSTIQNRINCMPATLLSKKVSGVKWVSVFPRNPDTGLPNVTGTMLLSDTSNGQLLAVIDAGYLTGLRTAAVGSVAAKSLACANPKLLGVIGAGAEAEAHIRLLKVACPSIARCRIASKTGKSADALVSELSNDGGNMELVSCADDLRAAVDRADIVVTATSAQEPLLKRAWVKPGALYIHVGGWEDEYEVALAADKIVCDSWTAVKHRGSQTIGRMFRDGLLDDASIYADLREIVAGDKRGRVRDDELIYFNSVGMALIDVCFAKTVYDFCNDHGFGTPFSFR